MPAGYVVLPEIYDRWQRSYGSDYSSLILPRLLSTVRTHKIPVTSMVDIACGTGSLAFMMAQRGWTVWGVDASAAMIAAAQKRVRSARSRARFLRQDMRQAHLPIKVDLATSMFDSLNHLLTPGELLKAFRAIRGCLNEGAFFVFDVNNERCFRKFWTKNEVVHHRDFTLILQNSYSRKHHVARSRVTLFLRTRGAYQKKQEAVWERCFTRWEVAGMLRKAGFRVVSRQDFNFTSDPSIGRVKTWWVARAV